MLTARFYESKVWELHPILLVSEMNATFAAQLVG